MDKKSLIKKILLFILGVFIIIIQNSIVNYLSIFGITINLVLIYLVIISLYLDELTVGIIGAILGLLLDASVGAVFGSNALILFLISYIVSILKHSIYKEIPLIILLLIVAASFVYCGLSLLLAKMVFNVYKITSIVKLIIVPLVNGFVGVLLYKLLQKPISSLEEEQWWFNEEK